MSQTVELQWPTIKNKSISQVAHTTKPPVHLTQWFSFLLLTLPKWEHDHVFFSLTRGKSMCKLLQKQYQHVCYQDMKLINIL